MRGRRGVSSPRAVRRSQPSPSRSAPATAATPAHSVAAEQVRSPDQGQRKEQEEQRFDRRTTMSRFARSRLHQTR